MTFCLIQRGLRLGYLNILRGIFDTNYSTKKMYAIKGASGSLIKKYTRKRASLVQQEI